MGQRDSALVQHVLFAAPHFNHCRATSFIEGDGRYRERVVERVVERAIEGEGGGGRKASTMQVMGGLV